MQEKQVSMEDAFQVWWFMAWRGFLVMIAFYLFLVAIVVIFKPDEVISKLSGTLSQIVGILTSVYFLKKAINRNYKNFRLSATEVTGQK